RALPAARAPRRPRRSGERGCSQRVEAGGTAGRPGQAQVKLEVEVAGKVVAVELEGAGPAPRVLIDGRRAEVDAVWAGAGQVSLRIDGRSYDVEIEPVSRDALRMWLGGRELRVSWGPAPAASSGAGSARKRSGLVTAP